MNAGPVPPRLVAAGAGSGKTYWIVERVVEQVAAGRPLDRIAAVTFTKAAAAELQDRIRARLIETGRVEEAARIDAAAICTIHQFALTVLRRYPLAAGLPPEPIVLEETQSSLLLGRALSDWIRVQLAGASAGSLRTLLDEGLGRGLGLNERGWGARETPTGRLSSLVRSLIEKARSLAYDPEALRRAGERAAALLQDGLGRADDATALRTRFDRALTEALAYVAANATPKATDRDFHEILAPVADQPLDEAGWVDLAIRIARHRPGGWTKGFASAPALHDAACAVTRSHGAMRDRLVACVRGVFDAAAGVLELFEREKRRIGAVDFEDMQVAALELLTGRGPDGLAYAPLLARTFEWIVVDEFQDTSPLQFRLFELLREHGSEVVYVGDLKQAIYGFRTADSALFAALLARATREGRPVEVLSASRRSRPGLVSFANDLFAATMPARGIPFEPLEADNDYVRGAVPLDEPCIELIHAGTTPAARGPREAAVVDRLRAMIAAGTPVLDRATRSARPMRWGDVAILASTNDDLTRWSTALRVRGIPSVLEQGELFATLEVRLAVAWLRWLSSPRDGSAAASVLLSELYGLSQSSVAQLAAAGVVGHPTRALELADREDGPIRLTAFERRALERCSLDLTASRRLLRQLPLDEAVEAVFERVDLALRVSLGADAIQSSRVRANLRRVAEIAHGLALDAERPLDLHGATGITLENLLIALERGREAHFTERAADDPGDTAVRLVTIHGSKGLEYPVVVLDSLAREFALRTPRIDVARPDDDETLLGSDLLTASTLRFVPEVGPRSLREALETMFDHEADVRRELTRQLYVAVTRARERLIVLWPADGKKSVTRRVRDVLFDGVHPPPVAQGIAAWTLRAGGPSHPVRVHHAAGGSPGDEAVGDESDDVAALVSLRDWLERDDAIALDAPLPEAPASARLALVSPTELCRVADCPEVPRLAVLHPTRHLLARIEGIDVSITALPSSRVEREALGDALAPDVIGSLLHAAVEHADLLGDGAMDDVRARLERRGAGEALDAMTAFATKALVAVRDALRTLGAVQVAGREVPIAVDVDGLVIHGAIDLVARTADGLHVIDLKAHVLDATTLPRWAGYYAPQLDAYALALTRTTGEPVVGRHLLFPASGMLVSLPGPFDPSVAARDATRFATQLVDGTSGPGPGNDCNRCAWNPYCRVAVTS